MSLDLDASEVSGWATSEGAQTLKANAATGCLPVDDPADLIRPDPEAPNLHLVIDGIGIVVHSGSAANVTDVMVDGAWLVRGRKPARVDGGEVIRHALQVSEALGARAQACGSSQVKILEHRSHRLPGLQKMPAPDRGGLD